MMRMRALMLEAGTMPNKRTHALHCEWHLSHARTEVHTLLCYRFPITRSVVNARSQMRLILPQLALCTSGCYASSSCSCS